MFVLWLLFLALSGSAAAQCLDEGGARVDWFVMFKMPNGYSYLYADAQNEQLEESGTLLTDHTNPVARVLEKVYSNSTTRDVTMTTRDVTMTTRDVTTSTNYILYNDQVPDGPLSNNRGHTKGILVWDEEYLTWIIHSAPNFPPQATKGYSYPESAMRYGQSFLCITLDVKALPDLATQLYYSWPLVYDYKVDEAYREKIALLDLVLRGKHVKLSPWTSIKTFQTPGSTHFKSFSKSSEFSSDLYKDLISPYFSADLYTETWQNGPGRLPSNCTGDNFVKNIGSMKLLGNEYKETQDHSKWAISGSSTGALVCVGGINRMDSQTKRGGGSVCFVSSTLWRQIFDGVQDVEECGGVLNMPMYPM